MIPLTLRQHPQHPPVHPPRDLRFPLGIRSGRFVAQLEWMPALGHGGWGDGGGLLRTHGAQMLTERAGIEDLAPGAMPIDGVGAFVV